MNQSPRGGIVGQKVERDIEPHPLGAQPSRGVRVVEIAGNPMHFDCEPRAQLRGECFEAVGASSRQHQRVPLPGQFARERGADPADAPVISAKAARAIRKFPSAV